MWVSCVVDTVYVTGANILITTAGVAKLADFGCSKVLDRLGTPTSSMMDSSFKRIQGTLPFLAPEGGWRCAPWRMLK